MKGIGPESYQQSGFTTKVEGLWTIGRSAVLVVKIQSAAGEAIWFRLNGKIVQENNDRDATDPQVIEVELLRVAVLVANEEVALFITQKLRRLAIRQTLAEVILK